MRKKHVLMSSIVLVLTWLPASPSDASVTVSADHETYIVDGAVVHHERFENDRREAATCTTCHWHIHLICKSWSDTAHGACPSLSASCPREQTVAEVMRADAKLRPEASSTLWHLVGHTCIGDGGPASVIDIEDELHDRWRIPLPIFGFRTRPPFRTLINLPTSVVFSASATTGEMKATVAGISVAFRSTAVRRIVCTPACAIDNSSLVFGIPGNTSINATAVWTASFDALGLKDIPVSDDPIIQRATQTIEVLRLHRFLETN